MMFREYCRIQRKNAECHMTTLPTDQGWLIDKAKLWLKTDVNKADVGLYRSIPGLNTVYATIDRGVCHGFSQVAIWQDWREMIDVLTLINDTPETELISHIEQALENRRLLVNSTKQSMLDWCDELIESKYQSITDGEQAIKKELSLTQKKRYIMDVFIDEGINDRDKLFLKLPAFFESIMIAQSPDIFYHGLLRGLSKGQDTVTVWPLILPTQVVIDGGLETLPTFSLCVDKAELMWLFEILGDVLLKKKHEFHDVNDTVSMQLSHCSHSVLLKYYIQSNTWRIFDINDVNLILDEISSNDVYKLASAIFKFFGMHDQFNPYIAFSIQFIVRSVNFGVMQSVIASCRAQQPWQDIMSVTPSKAKARMWDGKVSWLYMAVKNNDLPAVKELMLLDDDINSGGSYGVTPLIAAAHDGYLEIVDILLKAKAMINKPGDDGATPLFVAVQEGQIAVVEKLLAEGADVNTPMDGGATPLTIAFTRNYFEIARLLLNKNAEANVIYHQETESYLLFAAAMVGDLDWVQLLVEAKANVDQPTNQGATPLFIAAQYGYEAVARYLLQSNANPESIFVNTKHDLMKFASSYSAEVQARMRDFINDHSNLFTINIKMTPYDIAKIVGNDVLAEMILQAIDSKKSAGNSLSEASEMQIETRNKLVC